MRVRVVIAHGFHSVGDVIPDMPAAAAQYGIAAGRLERIDTPVSRASREPSVKGGKTPRTDHQGRTTRTRKKIHAHI